HPRDPKPDADRERTDDEPMGANRHLGRPEQPQEAESDERRDQRGQEECGAHREVFRKRRRPSPKSRTVSSPGRAGAERILSGSKLPMTSGGVVSLTMTSGARAYSVRRNRLKSSLANSSGGSPLVYPTTPR